MLSVAMGILVWFRHKGWIGSKEMEVPEEDAE